MTNDRFRDLCYAYHRRKAVGSAPAIKWLMKHDLVSNEGAATALGMRAFRQAVGVAFFRRMLDTPDAIRIDRQAAANH